MAGGAGEGTGARIVGRTVAYDRWSRLTEALLQLPGGAVEKRVIEDHGSAAAILLYDPGRRVALLVEQPRAPVIEAGEPPLLEAVAGRLDGLSEEATARKEALEEAGVRVGAIEKVATLWSMPAVSTERLALFLGPYTPADRVAAGGGAADENECITVHELPLGQLWQRAMAGTLTDGKTFTLLQALRLSRPALFD